MSTLAWTGIAIVIFFIIYLLTFKAWGRPKGTRKPARRIVPKAYTRFGDDDE